MARKRIAKPVSRQAARPARPAASARRLANILELERDRLRQVDAILGCLTLALAYSRESEARPSFSPPDVADAARSILNGCLERLDPTRVDALVAGQIMST